MSLSVVIPVAGEPSARRTLESLAAQEVPAEEILLVCPEGCPAAAEAAEMLQIPGLLDRLRILPVAPGTSAVELWNAGLAAAGSEWVSLLTPRVTVRPRFVAALQLCAERSESAAVLRAGWTRERFGTPGVPPEQHTLLSVRTVTHPAEALYEQRFGPKASTAAAAVRHSTWRRMGGLTPEVTLLGDWLGDWALWLTAGALGDTVRSPETIADLHAPGELASKAEEVGEMFCIYRDVLPRAARTAHLDNLSWIDAASRKRFRDVAIAASNDVPSSRTQERQAIAAALAPWADAVDQRPLLTRFESGERIRSFDLGRRVKPALRRVVAAIR